MMKYLHLYQAGGRLDLRAGMIYLERGTHRCCENIKNYFDSYRFSCGDARVACSVYVAGYPNGGLIPTYRTFQNTRP